MPATEELKRKLHPGRFTGCSPKMAAIIGFIVEEQYTNPAITELVVTSDQCVLAQHSGDVGANDFMGGYSDLRNNWQNLIQAAGLTSEEAQEANNLFRSRVVVFGASDARVEVIR
jgi:hypothetical protein